MRTLFTCFFFVAISFSSYSQSWIQKAAIPSHLGVEEPISFSINGKLYVGGGYTGTMSVKTFYEYNPNTDAWTQKANIPDSIYSACTFVLNGKGYVSCGADPGLHPKVYAYDPITNTWQAKNTFPGGGRQNLAGFSFQGKGYMCGGFVGGSNCSTQMWRYNDTTDSWAQMANMPGPGRNGTFPIVINNRAYVGLGSNASGTVWYSDMYCFNPDSNTYTRIADLPVASGGCAFFTIGRTGYIGLGSNGHYLSVFYKYNTQTNTWSISDTFTGGPRFVAFSQVVNGKPYIGCGIDSNGTYKFDNWTWGCGRPGITQHGDTLFASSGTSYQWYLNGTPLHNATGPFYIVQSQGNYTVEVYDDINTCGGTSDPYSMYTEGIDDVYVLTDIRVYPNPSIDAFTLQIPGELIGSTYALSDLIGKTILSGRANNEISDISIRDLPSGIYILHIGPNTCKVIKK